MQLRSVASSNLDKIGYDGSVRTMVIRFKSGAVYEYLNVPQDVHDNLLHAPSAGKYFNIYIRNKFQCRKSDIIGFRADI